MIVPLVQGPDSVVLSCLVGIAAATVALAALWGYFRPRPQGSKRPSVWVLVCAVGGIAAVVSVAVGGRPVPPALVLLCLVGLRRDELRDALRPANHSDG